VISLGLLLACGPGRPEGVPDDAILVTVSRGVLFVDDEPTSYWPVDADPMLQGYMSGYGSTSYLGVADVAGALQAQTPTVHRRIGVFLPADTPMSEALGVIESQPTAWQGVPLDVGWIGVTGGPAIPWSDPNPGTCGRRRCDGVPVGFSGLGPSVVLTLGGSHTTLMYGMVEAYGPVLEWSDGARVRVDVTDSGYDYRLTSPAAAAVTCAELFADDAEQVAVCEGAHGDLATLACLGADGRMLGPIPAAGFEAAVDGVFTTWNADPTWTVRFSVAGDLPYGAFVAAFAAARAHGIAPSVMLAPDGPMQCPWAPWSPPTVKTELARWYGLERSLVAPARVQSPWDGLE
jgi:hypothetical protein